jgi:Rrf2 family nitric oxide-sensitive transcriptional repressor
VKLTRYTDYALRVLMHLAAKPDRLSSIRDIALSYGISQNHLMKVVHDLQEGRLCRRGARPHGRRPARAPGQRDHRRRRGAPSPVMAWVAPG